MVGWHHRLNGYEFEQAPGDSKAGKPGVLQSMGSQRVGHSSAIEQHIIIEKDNTEGLCTDSKELTMLIYSSNDFNLDDFVKMVCPVIPSINFSFFFVIHKYFEKDTLRLCTYSFFCSNFLTHVSSHW